MIDLIKKYIIKNRLIDGCGHVVCGLSGGADSVCLLYVLNELKGELGYDITAVHVHHGIRGSEADRDKEFCEKLCTELKIRLEVFFYDVPAMAADHGKSVEEMGRILRYQSFEMIAARYGDSKIAVAHHGNDQVETIIFNLCRGTGISGLRGIKAERDNVIRPLLCVKREEILEFLELMKLDFCTDSTNADNDYTRNRIRNVIVPEMSRINEGALKNICSLADRMEELEEYLLTQTEEIYKTQAKREKKGILLEGLNNVHPYMAKSLIRRCISELTESLKDITGVHINNIYGLLSSEAGTATYIKYGIGVRRESDGLYFFKESEGSFVEIDIDGPGKYELPDGRTAQFIEILWNNKEKITKQVYTKSFDYDKIKNGLQIRNRRIGDYLIVDDKGHRKSLNRYFIDEKIPSRRRDEMLLLADGNHIIWVIDGRISESYKVCESTRKVLRITVV